MFADSAVLAWALANVAALAAPPPSPSPSPDASVPAEVSRLRATVDAARGVRPKTERVIEQLTENGRTHKRTIVHVGDDVRVTDEDGPFTTMYGTSGGRAWRQNANGLTVLDQPRNGAEAHERRTVSLQHVTSPIEADVIVDVNAKGDGTKTFVDPATHRVVRSERITPNETTVTTYDDFRRTGGYELAWHEHSDDGQPADDVDERIVSIESSGITTADVEIARPRRSLVTFPTGTTTTKLPVTLDENTHFVARIRIGARGYDFIVDTGAANGIAIDADTARGLGLTLYAQGSNAANAGRYVQSEAIVPEMDVGALTMRDVVVKVIPALHFENRSGTSRVVGLLGFDFIASLSLTFDYEKGEITATDYDAYVNPSGPDTFAVPIRLGRQGPETDLVLDGHLGEGFEIDTGGTGGVLISDVFTRRYPGITRGFEGGSRHVELMGVGGTFYATMYLVPEMKLGPLVFKKFLALVLDSDRTYSGGSFDGIIGPDVLKHFTMTTDYADSTLYFTPNSLGRSARVPAKP
ncbi:MAG: aspartyl protease family protein [Candidatus Eremiobacteraeota bacterium]|nr:aspartyl protease family protein [Candidatus Eremiobacteraeota bacterium]